MGRRGVPRARPRRLVRVGRWLIVTVGVGALLGVGAGSGVASPATSAPTATGVAQALYAKGPMGEACVVAQPSASPVGSVSYTGCPVSPLLATALGRYAASQQADALCRCQNSFAVTVSTKLAKPPSGYQGSKSDRTVRVTLSFGGVGGTITMYVIVHKSGNRSWLATDTFCAAGRGDKNPYANRMTGQPGRCFSS